MDTKAVTEAKQLFPALFYRIFGTGLLFLLITGLFVANVLLIQQNRQLKATIARKEPQYLKSGDVVPEFTGLDLSGQKGTISYRTRAKTVFFVFAPGCVACERTATFWKKIANASDRNHYQLFGLSLGDNSKSNEFLSLNGLNLETFTNIDLVQRDAFKLSLVPLKIIVDNSGTVEKVWPGAFNVATKAEIEQYFGISLDDTVR